MQNMQNMQDIQNMQNMQIGKSSQCLGPFCLWQCFFWDWWKVALKCLLKCWLAHNSFFQISKFFGSDISYIRNSSNSEFSEICGRLAPKHDMYVNASSRGWFPLYGETYMVIASESKGKGQPISVNDIALPKIYTKERWGWYLSGNRATHLCKFIKNQIYKMFITLPRLCTSKKD